MKSGPLSIFLGQSDNSVKLSKRPRKTTGELRVAFSVDFGRKGRLKASLPQHTSQGLKKETRSSQPGHGVRREGPSLCSHLEEPGGLPGQGNSSPHRPGWARRPVARLRLVITASRCRNS